jgi:hypothetical protein
MCLSTWVKIMSALLPLHALFALILKRSLDLAGRGKENSAIFVVRKHAKKRLSS